MFDLFGSEMPLPARFFIAFLVVLALIGVTAWVVRRFGANRLGGAAARGRQPRLAVIDAATVDARRRLVLIRRDNIEHLLMIGGPTDVVVEQNIVRAAGRDSVREPGRIAAPELAARAAAAETAWPLQPASEPAPVAPARSYRGAATEEPWLAPEPGARPRPSDTFGGHASEAPRYSSEFSAPLRTEPTSRAPVAPPPTAIREPEPGSAEADHNLAEMAMQLEAALRRGPAAEGRPPATDPLARTPESRPREFAPRFEPKLDVSSFEPKAERAEPRLDVRPETRFEPKAEPKVEINPEPRAESKTDKNLYDNLEEEMASLLGRPSGKP